MVSKQYLIIISCVRKKPNSYFYVNETYFKCHVDIASKFEILVFVYICV